LAGLPAPDGRPNLEARESNAENTHAVTTIVAAARGGEPARSSRRHARRRLVARVVHADDGARSMLVVGPVRRFVTTIAPQTTSDVVDVGARVRTDPSALDNLYKRGGPGVRVSPRYGR
jgi:hypothetical protein